MKEFDFVKLTLWIAVVLTAGLGGGYVWLGMKLHELENNIKGVEQTARRVGQITQDIKTLQEEKRSDKTPDSTDQVGINSYFAENARPNFIDPNTDYTLHPKEPEKSKDGSYTDTQYVLDFKRDRPKKRDAVMKFIWNCEARSRRIKLARAKLTLAEDKAIEDLWTPDSLTFVRRDPIGGKSVAPK